MKVSQFLMSVMILMGSGQHVFGVVAGPEVSEKVVTIETIKDVCQKCVLKLDGFSKYENLMGQFIFENGRKVALMCILYTLGEAKKDQLDQAKMNSHLLFLNESLQKLDELLMVFENMVKDGGELGLVI